MGYYFQSDLAGCKQRNSDRHGKSQIPLVGLLDTYKKLELPSYQEGFDRFLNGALRQRPFGTLHSSSAVSL